MTKTTQEGYVPRSATTARTSAPKVGAHTPGPWHYVHNTAGHAPHNGFFVLAQNTTKSGLWTLADVQPGDMYGKLGKANAKLIVSAPDLLAALQKLLSELDEPAGPTAAAVDAARAAVALAVV